MRCDVAIPIAGQWHLARPCIDAVIRRTPQDRVRLHLLDASGDPFIEAELGHFARTFPRTIAVKRVSNGLSETALMDDCLNTIQSDVGVVLAAGAIVTYGWLDAILRAFDRHPGLGIVSPLVTAGRNAVLPMLPGTDLSRMAELLSVHAAGAIARSIAPEPACVAVRRSALAQAGGVDRLFSTVQDALDDVCLRIQNLGHDSAAVLDAYVYFQNTYQLNADVKPDERARSRELRDRRWGAAADSGPGKELLALGRQMDMIPHAERLQYVRGSAGAPRVGDRLNLLFILPTLNPYGGVISVVNLLNELHLRGHRCTLVSLSECSRHPHTLYAQPEWVRNRDEIPARYAGDYDVVVATSWETADSAAAIAKASPRAHAMYFIQDLEDSFYPDNDPRRAKVLATYAEIAVKFAKTSYLCDAMLARGWPTHRIRPGMNLDLFYPHAARADGGATVLGMVRWGHLHRGYDLVLAVLENIKRSHPEVRIVIFGSNDTPRDKVPFEYEDAGRVAPSELPSIYSRADVFLEMSRHHGFGRTGVEAMACGAACVLSDSGGLGEYAVHGQNALIVPLEDVAAATQAVERLLDDTALRDRLIDNGFRTVSRYAEPRAADDFLGLVYRTHPAFQVWKAGVPAHA